jgi:Zn-dependent M28 family amino/carboxypeptidase
MLIFKVQMNHMKKIVLSGLSLILMLQLSAQKINKLIDASETARIEKALSSDDMEGRRTFTPSIDKAAAFIANEFASMGMPSLNGDGNYLQTFKIARPARWPKDFGPQGDSLSLANVVAILPGKSKPNEYVIFSGHYDHLGINGKRAVNGDSLFNGANDDAAGTTAMIMLAKYFKALGNNERTILFAAFTAEEMGGFGASYFSKQLNPEQVVAMFNIEMIGTESKWGRNSAYITGYEKSNMGEILQKNLKGSSFQFYPDPYTDQNLFYRSDNATLARLGVPAHTISTSKMDSEPNYHKPSDQFETLDMDNMNEIIKAIAISSRSIVSGKDTPSRVDTTQLKK